MRDAIPTDDFFAEPDPWAWCPDCENYYPSDCEGCPACEAEWGLDDAIGLGSEPPEFAGSDGWYRDLAARAEWPGITGADGWRDHQ
jgi:hypothetical protein